MRLYYLANIRLPTEKAHGIQIMKMCEAFANLGLEVELIVPKRRNYLKEEPFVYYGVNKKFKITRLWCLDLVWLGRVGFVIESLTFAQRAAAYCLAKNGIFYTRDEIMAFYLKTLGKKVTWEVHQGQKNIWVRLALALGAPIVVLTLGLKDLYKKFGVPERRILIAADAVDLKDFANLPSRAKAREEFELPDRKIITYIGKYQTLGKTKGVEEVLEVFADLERLRQDLYLLIIGPEPDELKEIESKLKDLGVPPEAYRLASHIPHLETAKFMAASDVLFMTYPNTPHYALYMSPLKLFEYMASGTPILAPSLPSLREVLSERNAYLFEPENSESLKLKLEEVLEEGGREQAKQAQSEVQNYTWEKRAKSILTFLM